MAALSLPPPNSHLALEMPGGAPRFLCFPRSVTAPAGSQAVLRCRISGDPHPCVLWERVGNFLLELGERCLVQRDGEWYQLVICDLRPEDSGHYMCRASNWAGEGYAGAKLTVTPNLSITTDPHPTATFPCDLPLSTKLPPITTPSPALGSGADFLLSCKADLSVTPDIPPHFLLTPTSQRLSRGQSGELSCRISGKPEPTVRWEKDGRGLEELCDGSHYRVSPGGHSLHISHVRPPDAGVYVCRATNPAGECLAAAVLLVDPTPRQAPEPTPGESPAQVKVFTVNEGKHAKLRCLVTGKPRPEIIWRKDGRAVSPRRRTLIYEDRDGHFILKVLFCRQQDRGLYVCGASNTAGNTLSAVMLHVREVGEQFPAPLRDVSVREGQDAVLECSVPDGSRTSWFLEDQRLHPGKRHHMEEQGLVRRLIIRGARTDDDGVYVCQTQRGSQSIAEVAVRGPIVKRLPRRLEVAEGGNAAFCAETDSEVEQVGWTQDGQVLSEDHRTVLKSFGRTHVLVLVGVTLQDAGIIQFHAGLSESTCQLRVKGRGLRVTPASEEPANRMLHAGQPISLSCHVPSSGAKVRWLKDGREVESGGRFSVQSDGRMRRLIISSAHASDTGSYTCHTANDSASFMVTVTEPPVKIVNTGDDTEHKCLNGERVVLSCEVSRESAPVRWYRDGVEVEETESVRLESDGKHRRLIIPIAGSQDSGEFVCDAGDDSVFYNVTVTEPPVKIVNTGDDTEHKCLNGERVVLSCEVSRENAPVRWYKDGVEVEETESVRLESDGKHRRLIIPNARSQDSGEFVCDAGDDSVFYNVTVTEPPVKIVNTSDDAEHKCQSGERVVLSCEVSRENAPVRWFRDDVEVEENENIGLESDGKHRRLIIPTARSQDSGEFVCDAGDDSVFYNVTVTAPLVTIVGNTGTPEHHVLMTGDDLVLACELSKPNMKVRWLHDGEELVSGGRVKILARGVHRQITILCARPSDTGTYTCDAATDQMKTTVQVEVPRQVEFVTEVQNVTVLEGEVATFKCVVSPDDVDLLWELNGAPVSSDKRVSMESNGLCHSLTLRSCRFLDSGIITANAEGNISRARLRVQEAQVLFAQGLQDTEVEEEQDVILQVQVTTERAEVHWVKQGVVIQPSSKFTLQDSDRAHSLTIHCVQPSDRGRYSCESLHDRTDCRLTVLPRGISVRKGLKDVQCEEGGKVELSVELSHDDLVGEWWKGGVRLTSSDQCMIKSSGRQHFLHLSALTLPDSGVIAFTTDTLRTTAQLTVTEHPLSITQPPQDFVVNEAGAATFQCEVSKHEVTMTWSKDGVQLIPSSSCRMYSVGRRRILQLSNCRVEDAGTYTCHVGDCTASATLRVLEQEPQMVRDLQDAELAENENAVFTCEVSCAQAKGEWFKNGEKIKITTTTKIRQEGRKHFLLMCGVQCQDSGDITFRARRAESRAKLRVTELPVRIVKSLRDKTALQGHRVILECKVTPPRAQVTWLRRGHEINPSSKYQISSDDAFRKLVIADVTPEDEDIYTVSTTGGQSSARLLVEGLAIHLVRGVSAVTVTAPGDACFECELSVPMSRPPQWSLNGILLHSGPDVILENKGTRHKLTLRRTHPRMTGTVRFTAGKTRSEAQLTVKE
ncbi:hypothetical protein FKM82_015464 [Ascaphus truei]